MALTRGYKGEEKSFRKLTPHARLLGTTINETAGTAGFEFVLASIYTVANGKDRVSFWPAAR